MPSPASSPKCYHLGIEIDYALLLDAFLGLATDEDADPEEAPFESLYPRATSPP